MKKTCGHRSIGYYSTEKKFRCVHCWTEFDSCPAGYKCSSTPGFYHKKRKGEIEDIPKSPASKEPTTILEWIAQLKKQFDSRSSCYMVVQKASLAIQLKDPETGCLHLHNITFKSKNALELEVAQPEKLKGE